MDPLVQNSVELRHGRFKIPNAYGSERLPLPMTVIAQYYNGITWVTNVADSLTAFNSNLVALGGNLVPTVVSGLAGGLTVSNPNILSLTSGVKTFTLAAPYVSGSADLSINTPSYLPPLAGRATFGIYRSPLIYRRENY